jgi:SAM-dependent methyltransferase
MRRFAPATERNRDPILGVLRRVAPPRAEVLEIASGTGEHAVYFTSQLDVASWQPSDVDALARASIDAWRTDDARVLPSITLDVTEPGWATRLGRTFDVVFCANMIHIAPFRACEGLLDGAPSALRPGGVLLLYGPFRRAGHHTAPSNEAFDASLRARDPAWGVRDLELVSEVAERHGLRPAEVIEMPANNLSVVFRNELRSPRIDA